MSSVKKAIIPAAGLGTRFLPATKTIPKEMLTIVDAPIIFYVVEEAVAAGVEDIILVQGRGKTAIEDFFDISYELEDKLAKEGKLHWLDRLIHIRNHCNIVSVRQKQPLGLGHAVHCGQRWIGNEPFAVLLGDEIMVPRSPRSNNTLDLLVKTYVKNPAASVVAVMSVAQNDVSKYGIADLSTNPSQEDVFEVKSFVEKPQPDQAPSRWALPGRYVFTPQIFQELSQLKPGKNGEFQLTDAMNSLLSREKVFATPFPHERFDAGDKLGYLKANVEMALRHPELRDDFRKYLIEIGFREQLK